MEMYFAVDKLPPEFMGDLLEAFRLAKLSNAKLGMYALVDSSFEHVRPSSMRSTWKESAVSLYGGTALDALSKASPYLYKFPDEPAVARAQMRGLLEMASGMPMISFIASEWGLHALAQSFKGLLEVKTADEQTLLLRFADARVLPGLDTVMRDESGDRWRIGVAYWWLPGRNGKLQTLPIHEYGEKCPGQTDKFIVLSQDSFNRLVSGGDADAILGAMFDQNPQVLDHALPSDNYGMVQRLLPEMVKLGVENFSDSVVFCTAAMLTSESFHLHQDFNSVLVSKKWVPGKLGDALFEINDAAWEEVESMGNINNRSYVKVA